MFLLRNKKNNFQLRTLIWGSGVKPYTMADDSGKLSQDLSSAADVIGA